MCEVLNRCSTIFTRLGWEVSVGEIYKPRKDSKPLKPSFILRYNGKIYGFVEVIDKDYISQESLKKTMELSDRIIKHIKPIIFVFLGASSFTDLGASPKDIPLISTSSSSTTSPN